MPMENGPSIAALRFPEVDHPSDGWSNLSPVPAGFCGVLSSVFVRVDFVFIIRNYELAMQWREQVWRDDVFGAPVFGKFLVLTWETVWSPSRPT